jgi:hypothetical protein
MIKKTIGEIIGILILALILSLLYHLISPSGLTIFKKKNPVSPTSSLFPVWDGSGHGS